MTTTAELNLFMSDHWMVLFISIMIDLNFKMITIAGTI
jgi:hypothetical protein